MQKTETLYNLPPGSGKAGDGGRHGRRGTRTAPKAGAAKGSDVAGDRGARSLHRRTRGRNRPCPYRDHRKARPAPRRGGTVQAVSGRLVFIGFCPHPAPPARAGEAGGKAEARYPKCLWKNAAIGSNDTVVERWSFGT